MKVYTDVIQGTPECLYLRAGLPTASNFDRILTPGGKPSKSAEPYMFTLLAERMMGHPVEEKGFSRWMDRGNEMEAEAVSFYHLQREDTVKVGFITNEAGTIGASPDRLVGDRGLLEIKVPAEHTHVSYLMQIGGAYQEYRVQVQGQLWIAEREWCDVLSYHPEMPPALYRIERDEDFIEKLACAVEAFAEVLEQHWATCVANGWVAEPKPKPTPSASDMMREALLDAQRQKESA